MVGIGLLERPKYTQYAEKHNRSAGILVIYNILFGVYLSYVMRVHQVHSKVLYNPKSRNIVRCTYLKIKLAMWSHQDGKITITKLNDSDSGVIVVAIF